MDDLKRKNESMGSSNSSLAPSDESDYDELTDDSFDYSDEPESDSSVTYYSYTPVNEGSYLLGVVLVLFLNFIGLVIAFITGKRKTRKAAIITFIVDIALSIVIAAVFYVLILLNVINIDALREMMQQ